MVVEEHAACADCGEPVGAQRYCGACGQPNRDPVPTVRSLFGQFFDDYFSLDSKLVRTLGLLLRRPGALTVEYLAGRQTRYVRPLRLYLICSLLFFVVMTTFGDAQIVQTGDRRSAPESAESAESADAIADPDDVARALRRADLDPPTRRALALAFGDAALDSSWVAAVGLDSTRVRRYDDVEKWPLIGPPLVAKARSLEGMTAEELQRVINRSIVTNLPKAVFALLPVFALVLGLVYVRSRRRYAEHFVFALHAHAFAFLVLTPTVLVSWDWFAALVLLLVAVYVVLAMKRYYGQGWAKTLVKYVGLSSAYITLQFVVLVATTVVSFLTL